MSIGNMINLKYASCSHETQVKEIANIMLNECTRSVLIEKDNEPHGIVTDVDLLKCLAEGKIDQKAEDIMSRPVARVPFDSDLSYPFDMMTARHIRHVVVVDNNQKTMGLLSAGDLLAILQKKVEKITELINHRVEDLEQPEPSPLSRFNEA